MGSIVSEMEEAKSERRWTQWVILLLGVCGVVMHWPDLATFKADDYPAIAYASDWSRVAHDFAGPQYDLRFFLFYRPLITLSLAIDHLFFGSNAFGFLAMNSLACIASAILIFGILRRLLPDEREPGVAAGVALLWLVHPVLIHSTAWVVGRVDTHVVFWILLSLWLHLGRRRGGSSWPVWLTLALALMTKEYALGAPLLLLGLDLVDPCRVESSGPRLAGRRLLALPTLLLIPTFLLLRKWLLGSALGGYGFLEGQPLDPISIIAGLWTTLGQSLLPIGPEWLRTALLLLTAGLVLAWICRTPQHRTARLAGALLVSAGLFAPLAPLLPSMRDPGQHRYAYLAVIWPWVALIGGLTAIRQLRQWSPLLVIPSAMLLVASRAHDRALMRSHDVFVRSVVESLHAGDAAMAAADNDGQRDATSPLLLAGDAEASFHPQRFLWGLGSVLKPPFGSGRREVLSLRKLHPLASPVTVAFVGKSHRGLIAIGTVGALPDPAKVWGTTPLAPAVAPRGFDGVMTPARIEEMRAGAELGWPAGEGYGGQVAICTGFGSFVLPLSDGAGLLRLADLLQGNVSYSKPGTTNLVLDLLWNGFDLAKDSPISIYWNNAQGLQRAELRVSPDFPAWYWGLRR